jgi:hypothetical protein
MFLFSYLFISHAIINTEKLIAYIEFIKQNAQPSKIPYKTHSHHIIQKAILRKLGLPKEVVDSKDNLVHLLFQDHLKAHLLWIEAVDCWESRSTLGIFKKIFDNQNIDLNNLTQNDRVCFIQRLEEYYKELQHIQRRRRLGCKASLETIEKMRIAGTRGKGKKHNRRKENKPRNISLEGYLAKQEAGRKQSENLSIHRAKAHEMRRKFANTYEGWYMQEKTGVLFNIKRVEENGDLGFKNFKWVFSRKMAGGHKFIHISPEVIKEMIDNGSFSSVYDIPKGHPFLKDIRPVKKKIICPFCGSKGISTNTGWLSHHLDNCKKRNSLEFLKFE